MLLAWMMAMACLPPGNLVSNPSFETGLSGWGGDRSSWTVVTLPDAPDGARVVRVAVISGTEPWFTLDDQTATLIGADAGRWLAASVFVRSAAAATNGKSILMYIRELEGTTDMAQFRSPTLVLDGGGWVRLATPAAGPTVAGRSYEIVVAREVQQPVAGEAFYVDAISMVYVTGPDAGDPCAPATDAGPSVDAEPDSDVSGPFQARSLAVSCGCGSVLLAGASLVALSRRHRRS